MKKYNKKIALILALATVLALAIPALAAQTEINGTYRNGAMEEIHVLVTGQVNAFLNPKGYDADVYSNSGDTVVGTLNRSAVVSRPIVGVNLGGGAVDVKATVNSALKGKFKFATSAPKATATSVNGQIYLEVENPASELGFSASYNDQSTEAYGKFDGKKVVDAMNAFTAKEGAVTASTPGVIILKKGVASIKVPKGCTDTIVTLQPATDGTPVAASYFVARLNGTLGLGNGKGDAKDWAATDGFDAIITWSFSPAIG